MTFIFGLGGTTPLPKVLLGRYFDILTFERFTLWAALMVLPLVGAFAEEVMERHGKPLYSRLEKLINEGIASGDFRRVDPMQTVTSILGTIVFYFISMPAQQFMLAGDPASPERIAARRAAVLDFICAAVFTPDAAKKVCQP